VHPTAWLALWLGNGWPVPWDWKFRDCRAWMRNF